MPYTNPWDDTTPLGTANANTIDDIIRQLKLDIHERMDGIVVDWEADPVVPLAAIGLGNHGVGYDDDESAGNKIINPASIVSILSLYYIGTAATGGVVTINLNEINDYNAGLEPPVLTDWQVGNIYNPHPDEGGNTFLLPLSFVGRTPDGGSGNEPIHVRRVITDIPANTITLSLENAYDSPAGTGRKVRFWASFGFTVAPDVVEE